MSTEEIAAALMAARDYVSGHPAEARYRDSTATAVWAGGLAATVTGPSGERLSSDMPKGVGGGGAAASPG